MLVLARRVDEGIAIGDSIVITVLEIEGDRVKLGIEAPRDILILRKEILQAVQAQEKLQAKLLEAPEDGRFDALRELLSSESDLPENGDQE